MAAPETTTMQEELYACIPAESGNAPPCQVQVAPSLEFRTGRSVNPFALAMEDYARGETGAKESVAELQSLKANRT